MREAEVRPAALEYQASTPVARPTSLWVVIVLLFLAFGGMAVGRVFWPIPSDFFWPHLPPVKVPDEKMAWANLIALAFFVGLLLVWRKRLYSLRVSHALIAMALGLSSSMLGLVWHVYTRF